MKGQGLTSYETNVGKSYGELATPNVSPFCEIDGHHGFTMRSLPANFWRSKNERRWPKKTFLQTNGTPSPPHPTIHKVWIERFEYNATRRGRHFTKRVKTIQHSLILDLFFVFRKQRVNTLLLRL